MMNGLSLRYDSGNLVINTGDINITAAQNSMNSNSKTDSNSLSQMVSVSGGGIFIHIPTISDFNSSSKSSSNSYLGSSISALEGSLNIKANGKESGGESGQENRWKKGDTNIIGSSLLAQDINIETNNLKLESLQNQLTAKSDSNSISLGGNIGFSNSNTSQDRLWVDQIASILGTNSVNIDVGKQDQQGNYFQGTGNTNLIASVIANIISSPPLSLYGKRAG